LVFGFLVLAFLLNNPIYDAIGSILIGVILVTVAIFTGIRIKSLLIGESADPMSEQKVKDIFNSDPDIEEMLVLISIQLGQEIMISAKLKLNDSLNINKAITIINTKEKEIHAALPSAKWLFIEPDIDT
jgi:divalent metal cation (Fe/Co/Zn/Cd) transporter